MKTVSVKKESYGERVNAHQVVVTIDYGGVKTSDVYHVHTGQDGKGLWIGRTQIEGNAQFDAGKRPADAIRRYFQTGDI